MNLTKGSSAGRSGGPTPEWPQPQSEQMNSESHQSDHEA